jgi:hypothetical protein
MYKLQYLIKRGIILHHTLINKISYIYNVQKLVKGQAQQQFFFYLT